VGTCVEATVFWELYGTHFFTIFAGSLKDFVEFLVDTNVVAPGTFDVFDRKIKRWCTNLRTDILKRRVLRRALDEGTFYFCSLDIDESSYDMRVNTKILSFTENKILPEDIRRFQDSDAFRKATDVFKQFSDDAALLKADYITMRNFLLTNILIDNAQRAGTLISMRMRHIRNKEEVGGNHILTVSYC
jgi:hypothetical protein